MKKTVVISGAAGFVGSHLTRAFLSDGIDVVALVRSEKTNTDRLPAHSGLRTVVCPNEALDMLPDLLGELRPTAFVHAAWSGNSGPTRADFALQLRNASETVRAYEVADRIGAGKFVGIGTVTERVVERIEEMPFANSQNLFYGYGKSCARRGLEIRSRTLRTPYVWATLSNVYGEGNETGNLIHYTLAALLSDRDAEFGAGEQPYDFIHIDDVTEALKAICLSDCPRREYFVGSGSPKRLKEYLLEVGAAVGRESRVHLGARPDDGVRYESDWFRTDDLTRDFGYRTSVPFAEGVRRTVQSMLNKEKR